MAQGAETYREEDLYRTQNIHRVVVTGVGAVTPLGNTIEESWRARIRGESGIHKISTSDWEFKADTEGSVVDIAGLVMNFDVRPILADSKEARRLHRTAQFSLQAGRDALVQAGFLDPEYRLEKGSERDTTPLRGIEPEDFGAIVGTGIGGGSIIAELEDIIRGLKKDVRVDANAMILLLPERVATVPSMFMDLEAEVSTIGSACATGALAIAAATRIIRDGEAIAMLAGAAEAAVHRVGLRGFDNMHALNNTSNDNPSEASRPFDTGAAGFVMGEGGATLVLESLDHALARGANILAEVVGYGNTADSNHETRPNQAGPSRAMRKALAMAEIDPSQVDFINAHGTSTKTNDPNESIVYRSIFGENVPILSSDKSAIGHLLGASGAVEAAFSVQTIQDNIVPPNLNLHELIAEALGFDIPTEARRKRVDIVMSNSFGFGGVNTSLIFRRFQRSYERVA